MTNVDSQRIKEIRDNTKAMAEAFSSIANTLADALEVFIETRTETQNSNLTFEKDECAKEYEELGLKELKELIEADRKTEPQTKPKCEINEGNCDGCGFCEQEPKDEPTISKMEQVDKDINVRSKESE